jgi:hypothetical protein
MNTTLAAHRAAKEKITNNPTAAIVSSGTDSSVSAAR